MAANTPVPHFIGPRPSSWSAVALIGTTITPYIQLYTAGAVVDRGIGPEEYQYERVDAVSGRHLRPTSCRCASSSPPPRSSAAPAPLNSAAEAAKALEPLAGPGAEALFGIGLLGASALAAAVVPLSTSYAVAEAVGVERSVSQELPPGPAVPRACSPPRSSSAPGSC